MSSTAYCNSLTLLCIGYTIQLKCLSVCCSMHCARCTCFIYFRYLQFIKIYILLFVYLISIIWLHCRYKAVGIRLDSGDLAYLSCQARNFFISVEKEFGVSGFGKTNITASNDLNEETLDALNKQVILYLSIVDMEAYREKLLEYVLILNVL